MSRSLAYLEIGNGNSALLYIMVEHSFELCRKHIFGKSGNKLLVRSLQDAILGRYHASSDNVRYRDNGVGAIDGSCRTIRNDEKMFFACLVLPVI